MVWESPLFLGLMIGWIAVTVVYVLLAFYRSMIGLKEDDQLFLDDAEKNFADEQAQLQKKLNKLKPFTRTFGWASGGLLAVMVGLLVIEGVQRLKLMN